MLVGDPGAGKSTFLRRIAFAACETLLGKNAVAAEEMLPKPCPFPILIRAASLAEYIRKRKAAPAGDHPAETDAPAWRIPLSRFRLPRKQLGPRRRFLPREIGRRLSADAGRSRRSSGPNPAQGHGAVTRKGRTRTRKGTGGGHQPSPRPMAAKPSSPGSSPSRSVRSKTRPSPRSSRTGAAHFTEPSRKPPRTRPNLWTRLAANRRFRKWRAIR